MTRTFNRPNRASDILNALVEPIPRGKSEHIPPERMVKALVAHHHNVSKLLKEWRAQARPRLLQEDAAKILGVSLRTLQGWEAGRSCPYPRLVELALKALS